MTTDVTFSVDGANQGAHFTARRSESHPADELDLASRRRRHRDRPELRRVHETLWRSVVRPVEQIEHFGPELERRAARHRKRALQRHVHLLESRTIDAVPSGVAEG